MLPSERRVAGLTCSEVLGVLSDVVDGEVADEIRGRVEAHVRDCQRCERFGSDFARLLEAFRRQMSQPAVVPPDTRRRLLEAVASL